MGLLSTAARNGRNGDTRLAHVTPGEVVIPKEVARYSPGLISNVANRSRSMGIDPSRTMVGHGRKNPKTGIEEFATKKEIATALLPQTAAQKAASTATVIGTPGGSYDYALTAGQNVNAVQAAKAAGISTSSGIKEFTRKYNPNTDTSTYKTGDAITPRLSAADQKYANKYSDPLPSYTAPVATGTDPATVPTKTPAAIEAERLAKEQADAAAAAAAAAKVAPSYLTPADLTKRNVGTNETVSGNMNTLLDEDGQYIQDARNRSMMQMNERGLINTSIAGQAGQQAAIQAALQIANPDAATYGRAADYNASLSNQAAMHNMDAANSFASQNIDIAARVQAQTREFEQAIKTANINNTASLSNNIIQNNILSPEIKRRLLDSLGQKGLGSATMKDNDLLDNITNELIKAAPPQKDGKKGSTGTTKDANTIGTTPKGYDFEIGQTGPLGGAPTGYMVTISLNKTGVTQSPRLATIKDANDWIAQH